MLHSSAVILVRSKPRSKAARAKKRTQAQLLFCARRNPSVIPASAQPYLKLAPNTQSVSVELTYRDGSVSEIKSFRR